MNKTERMCYTMTGYSFTEISKGKGSIEYQLMDDFGNSRTVTAMARINMFKKVKSVRPIYLRELPLIQALANTKLNDSVVVDFSEFNKKHVRGSMRKKRISIPSVKIKNVGTSYISDVASLKENKTRFVQLMFMSITGFVVVAYILSLIPSPYS